MARQRSYRHDVRCPHCGSNWIRKDGHTRGEQIYKCGECNRKHSAGAKRHHFSERVKEQAVEMCIEGMSLSAAARVVGASVPTVSGWVKKRGFRRGRGCMNLLKGGQAVV